MEPLALSVGSFVVRRIFLNGMVYDKQAPKLPQEGASVRMNISAILREDSLFQKKQENEVKLLKVVYTLPYHDVFSLWVGLTHQNGGWAVNVLGKAYEEDLRDCTEFYRWQKKVRDHDVRVQIARVS